MPTAGVVVGPHDRYAARQSEQRCTTVRWPLMSIHDLSVGIDERRNFRSLAIVTPQLSPRPSPPCLETALPSCRRVESPNAFHWHFSEHIGQTTRLVVAVAVERDLLTHFV